MVVSHSARLVAELGIGGDHDADTETDDDTDTQGEPDEAGAEEARLGSPARSIVLVKDLGETFVQGQGLLTAPAWTWGARR